MNLHKIIFKIMQFVLVSAQFISIQDINESTNPIAKIELGECLIIQTYKNIKHIIDLQEYESCVEQFSSTLNLIQQDETLIDAAYILEGKIAQLREKIEILTPSGKQKRGLVNGLGSIVKSITGNMDANDGQEIEEKIDTLKEKERNLTNALLDQEAFNNEIQIRFQDVAKSINQEQAMISRF
ncbi:uncharacterized protein LOC122756459 [Drosophila santomea]|uniref:uncharacterized protein LOC122756459 n=1 Tax=Drosophila santomea TaxID=129105 RepID=UPI001CCA094C|nr:uncharacterized protein LOC122756459 [Drosophila santomea]